MSVLNTTIKPFNATAYKDGKFVDRQFVYPCNVYHTFILYNKNIFDKYGVPYPPEDLTWDQYIEIARKLTVYHNKDSKLPDIFGAAGVSAQTIIFELGGDYFNESGTRSTVDTKPFVDAYEMLRDFYFKYNVEPSPMQKAGVTSQGGHGAGADNRQSARFWAIAYTFLEKTLK